MPGPGPPGSRWTSPSPQPAGACVRWVGPGPAGPGRRRRLLTPAPTRCLPACGCDLAEGGFFVRQGEYICTLDYQRLYGTRCFSCDRFIEGEVVSALGKTYHPACFVCNTCR